MLKTKLFVFSVASQSYMQSLLSGVVSDVGFVDRDSDTHLERYVCYSKNA